MISKQPLTTVFLLRRRGGSALRRWCRHAETLKRMTLQPLAVVALHSGVTHRLITAAVVTGRVLRVPAVRLTARAVRQLEDNNARYNTAISRRINSHTHTHSRSHLALQRLVRAGHVARIRTRFRRGFQRNVRPVQAVLGDRSRIVLPNRWRVAARGVNGRLRHAGVDNRGSRSYSCNKSKTLAPTWKRYLPIKTVRSLCTFDSLYFKCVISINFFDKRFKKKKKKQKLIEHTSLQRTDNPTATYADARVYCQREV